MDARKRLRDEIARKVAGTSKMAQMGKPEKRWWWSKAILLCAIVAVLVSAAIAYLFPMFSVNKSDDVSVDKAMRKHPPALNRELLAQIKVSSSQEVIKKMRFRMGGKFIRTVVAENKPVLVQDAPITKWSSYRWDLLEMAKKHPQLQLNATRFQIKEPVFILTHERERGGMLGSHKDRPMYYTNVSLALFLREALNENKYLFWTGDVMQWERETGIEVTMSSKHEEAEEKSNNASSSSTSTSNSWKIFRVVEKDLSKSIDEDDLSHWRPMLWLAHPGSVAAMHYDTSHNFIVQVQGFTRFLILPPDAETYLYPNIHVSYRQSQVTFEEPMNASASSSSTSFAASFPLLKSAAYEVQLGPGDVLYVPPYYHFRMECTTLSLSLSINSPSIVEAALSEAYWQQVPFGSFQSKEGLRVAAVTTFLTLLVEGEGGDSNTSANLGFSFSLSQLARHLYTTRFEPLITAATPAKFLASSCYHVKSKVFGYEAQLEAVSREESQYAALLLEQNNEAFLLASKKIRDLLSGAPTTFASVRQTWLLDYIEQLSRFAVGLKAVSDFISLCLAN